MIDKILIAQAWKATEWLIRRFKSRDDAQEILSLLHSLLETQALWPALKAVVEAIKAKDISAAVRAVDALAELWKVTG